MAKVIKGITVEIGGNASPLNKALNDVNKTSKSLQSELRTIDKLLKLDPTNVELLKQKQDVLSESIATTEEKLRRLKSAEEKVAQAFEDGKIDAEQYRAFQRNIVTTEQKLNDLKSELDKTGQAITDLGTDAQKSEKKLDDYKKEVDDVKSAVSDLKDKAKDTALELGAGITAAGGAASAAIMSFNSVDSALNHIQASTNLSKGQMDGFRDALEEIYNGNYGDDLSDIASKMANIVQYTNETDPDKIKDYAIKLYGLQDTFDLDFNETLRGTQGLIKNMGLTADQAFDYIASGAQNGLNYSGELSDNLSEYTSLFGQAGFTAEQMFAILDNGTESGAYNLDKVNDFVKEFTISLADGRIEENISSFSDGTGDLFKQWKDGKATAADVFYSVINDLSTAENKQTALTTASNVWSSLGEDNALNIITSLDDVNTKFSDVKGTMDEVNDIEYDDLGNRLEGLGRKVQTEIINPAVEDFYPEAEDFIDWLADNLDTLIPLLEGVAKQVAIVWSVKKGTEIAKSVANLIDNYKTLAKATKTATDGQKGLNAAQKANVIGVVVGAVLSLISAIDTYNETQWENSSLKKEIDKTKELTDNWNDLADSMSSKIEEINDTELDMKVNFDDVNKLKERLQEIIKDGTIDENEKGEYTTIIDLLSGKVDGFKDKWSKINLKTVNGEIKITDNIDTVNKSLDDLIAKWELTQVKMTMSEMYNSLKAESAKKEIEVEALKDEANIESSKKELIDYIFDKSSLDKKESKILADELISQEGDYEKVNKSLKNKFNNGSLDKSMYENLFYAINNNKHDFTSVFGWKDWNGDVSKRIKEYTDNITDYNESIKNGETQLAKMKDKTDGLYSSLKILQGGQGTYNDYIKLSTEYGMSHEAVLDLIKDKSIKTWNDLEKAAQEKGDNIVGYNTSAVRKAKGAYEREFHPEIAVSNRLDETESAIENKSVELENAASTTMQNTQNAANIGGWFNLGGGLIGQIIGGIFGRNGDVENAGQTSAENAKTGAGKVSLFSTGVSRVASFISGLFSDENDPETAGEKVAGKAKTGSGKVSLFSIGNNLVSGFINGILSGEAFKRIGSAAMSVAQNAYDTIKSWLGINSPAKKTIEIGEYFSEGFSLGIENEIESAEKSAEYLAENTLSAMRARQKIINSFNQTNNDQNNMILPSVSAQIRAQAVAKSNNAPDVKQINLGGLTLKIEHFENRSAADVNKVTDQFMQAVENYVSRRDAFK